MPSLATEIRMLVEPILLKEGFEGEYPEYIRTDGEVAEIINVQVSKYGGAFFINLYVFTEEQMEDCGWRNLPWEERSLPDYFENKHWNRVSYGLFKKNLIKYGTDYHLGAKKMLKLLPQAFHLLSELVLSRR